MQELINKLKGKNIIVGSDWVKENDELLYEFLLDKLRGYKLEDDNPTTQEDIEEFRKGNWLVELHFEEDGMNYCAGPDKQAINNQPPWGEDSYEDCEAEQLRNYLQQG